LAIDESITLAQGLASGNVNTLSFWMLPQWHSGMGRNNTLKNRRLVEDKVLGLLAIEVNMNDFMFCLVDQPY